MSWSAADGGADLADFDRLDLRRKEVIQRWIALGRTLGPLTVCAKDETAQALVAGFATLKVPAEAWLRRHLAWARHNSAGGEVGAGSVVCVPNVPGRHVVVAVELKKVWVYMLAKDRVVGYRLDAGTT